MSTFEERHAELLRTDIVNLIAEIERLKVKVNRAELQRDYAVHERDEARQEILTLRASLTLKKARDARRDSRDVQS